MIIEQTGPDREDREVDGRTVIESFYKGFLRRNADPEGLKAHIERMDKLGLLATIEEFTSCEEFQTVGMRMPPGYIHLNLLADTAVETDVSTEQLEKMWNHVASVWSGLGENDAMWSVLTDEQFKTGNLTPEAIDSFYAGGEFDVSYIKAFLGRAGIDMSSFEVGAEYGCGVGRMTPWLAPFFQELRAFDISAPHLVAAEKHGAARGLDNVEYVHVRTRSDLGKLSGIDFFVSLIVLQHNPPPIILDILDMAFAGLRPGGVALFQVPTFGADYAFDVTGYWKGVAAKHEMEVHFVPQIKIYELARKHGLDLLETRQDHCIGNFDKWISNTFVFRKSGGAC